MIPSGFSFLINLGHFGGALQRSWRPLRIAQRFCQVWLNAHFASYRLFNPGSHGRFHFCSHTRSFLSALCILRHKCSEDVFKLDFGIERTAASSMGWCFRFEIISETCIAVSVCGYQLQLHTPFIIFHRLSL